MVLVTGNPVVGIESRDADAQETETAKVGETGGGAAGLEITVGKGPPRELLFVPLALFQLFEVSRIVLVGDAVVVGLAQRSIDVPGPFAEATRQIELAIELVGDSAAAGRHRSGDGLRGWTLGIVLSRTLTTPPIAVEP